LQEKTGDNVWKSGAQEGRERRHKTLKKTEKERKGEDLDPKKIYPGVSNPGGKASSPRRQGKKKKEGFGGRETSDFGEIGDLKKLKKKGERKMQ